MIDHYAHLMTTFAVFEGYTTHGTKGLIERGHVRELHPGDLLFKEGDPAKTAVLVLTGEIELFVHREGRDLLLTGAGASRMLGELAVMGGVARATSARAVQATAVLEWDGDTFRRAVMSDAVLSERVIRQSMRTLVEEELALVASLAALKDVTTS
jgi:CRP-like cAMP-binding protein